VTLPQREGSLFITDGGMETTLIFHEGLDLPSFASFVLLEDEGGRRVVRNYYEPYVAIAREQGVGAVLDTATWRANPDWGTQLGYSPERLADVNRRAVSVLEEVLADHPEVRIVINGVVGPRGDGYVVSGDGKAAAAGRRHRAGARRIELWTRSGGCRESWQADASGSGKDTARPGGQGREG
jgi:S-methylmethionine-dependent homocysteine/selenocysteine methylase